MTTPEIGDLIASRYRLDELIGRGGMATVYRAHDTRLDRPVAIKLLRPEAIADVDLAIRFRREAHAATVLRHPNVVACFDTGTHGDSPFLAMELVEGEDLSARIRRDGPLPIAAAVRIATDAALGLGVAHARGFVHRDVKPGNILLAAADGRARVTDFGIARLAAEADVTSPGTTLGSVHYFSPEQARGGTATPASDVYSLGLVLYEMLTGERPWTGDSPAAIALARVDAEAPSPRAIRPEIPVELDAIVRRALAPEPGGRYPTGAAIAAALEAVGRPADPSSPTIAIATPGVTATTQLERRPLRRSGTARTSSPLAVVGPLAILLLVAGIALGGLILLGLDGDGGSAAVPTADPTTPPSPEPATPRATEAPTPAATPAPTPEPTVPPTPRPPGVVTDLCQPVFGGCPLEAGRYRPDLFRPGVEFVLGDGWFAVINDQGIVALVRDEGWLTFATGVTEVFRDGEPTTSRGRPRDLIDAFTAMDGVDATRPVDVRVDRRRGLSVDLTPTGTTRMPLFANGDAIYFLEPDGATRVIAVDVRGDAVLIVIEPTGRFALDHILAIAGPVVDGLRWR